MWVGVTCACVECLSVQCVCLCKEVVSLCRCVSVWGVWPVLLRVSVTWTRCVCMHLPVCLCVGVRVCFPVCASLRLLMCWCQSGLGRPLACVEGVDLGAVTEFGQRVRGSARKGQGAAEGRGHAGGLGPANRGSPS